MFWQKRGPVFSPFPPSCFSSLAAVDRLRAEIEEKYRTGSGHGSGSSNAVSVVYRRNTTWPVAISTNTSLMNGYGWSGSSWADGISYEYKRYLSNNATKADVARLLRKAAMCLEGSAFNNSNGICDEGGSRATIPALEECVSQLKWLEGS